MVDILEEKKCGPITVQDYAHLKIYPLSPNRKLIKKQKIRDQKFELKTSYKHDFVHLINQFYTQLCSTTIGSKSNGDE